MAIAEFCVHQLLDTTNTSDPRRPLTSNDLVSDGVGWVYKTKVKMLCDSYYVYSAGLQEAQTLLSQLKGYTGFSSYLDKLNNPHLKMDIRQFLNHPIKVHISPLHTNPYPECQFLNYHIEIDHVLLVFRISAFARHAAVNAPPPPPQKKKYQTLILQIFKYKM